MVGDVLVRKQKITSVSNTIFILCFLWCILLVTPSGAEEMLHFHCAFKTTPY